MRTYRDIPIKQKLVIMIMVSTTAALLLAGLGIVLTDSILFRGYLRRDLSALAKIIADNSTAALAFNDPQAAAETLAALRARSQVLGACIYEPDRAILASYFRPGVSGCPPVDSADEIRFNPEGVIVSQAIVLAGRRMGTLMILYGMGEISERVKLYGSMVFGVLVASSLLAFLLSSRLRAVIEEPIAQLVRATTVVSETGDYSTRAPKTSGDELGVLVDRFNEMLAGIQSREEALNRERERFRFMAESMPQKIFTATPHGDVDYFNRQWTQFTGLSFDQIKDWGWTQFVHPDDLADNLEAWHKSLDTGQPFHFEHRFRRADGKYRWHLSRAQAMRDARGGISMWIASSTDIHEQKEKEQALRRANDDLQQFAYAASHDLQEPIRNVAVYSEIVARRYHNLLDADGQQFLGFLREGGRRLATLVNDLLAYTRAGTAEIADTPVDATLVLKHTLASLAEAIRESNGTVTYDLLPEVFIGEAHLQQVLQNLIGNALKYRDQNPPRVHVSAAGRGAFWVFSVEDNGIGIDPQYKEKIFGVFKRLHHDTNYSGTGIGLAICQRVVERYGGRIWVESEPGKGSTFYFTVPRHAQTVRPAAVESSTGRG
jgi:PAS domain S-box-containing protein